MFDPRLNSLLGPVLKQTARLLVTAGVSANQVTVVGFLIGMLALPLLAVEAYSWALAMIVINRIADGLDGAVARLTHTTDAGGYLDITFDFIFYSAVVFGFLLANPEQNAIAAGLLLVTFMGTGSTFWRFPPWPPNMELKTLSTPVSRCTTWVALPKALKPFWRLCCFAYGRNTLSGWR